MFADRRRDFFIWVATSQIKLSAQSGLAPARNLEVSFRVPGLPALHQQPQNFYILSQKTSPFFTQEL
jgi:hypothetical protein